ncbi:hypothetical protein HCN44_001494 [Aphidius gifuensis]|uniref:Uncharacterized protein n=1 Tax=Aphidius gifuensis TaxID=684658 RepID=A0A834XVZ0_APHGI|nr:hypothetical protein HCN44_001494 [Aphidius gifuensis]
MGNPIVICVTIIFCLTVVTGLEDAGRKIFDKNIETDQQKNNENESTNSTDYFIFMTPDKILRRPYFSKYASLSEIKITNSPNFTQNLTNDKYNAEFLSDCSNKRIYILKKPISQEDYGSDLDVIEYDDSKKFTRINSVSKMFDEAKSLSLDWTTGNIFWTEKTEGNKSSIKFTNKLFEEPQYIIQPTDEILINNIRVYPKLKQIIFSDGGNIWYTSTFPNSTAELLFSSTMREQINRFEIDYALDKLCFTSIYTLNCISINSRSRRIERQSVLGNIAGLSVLNGTFYWLAQEKSE